MDWLLVYFMLWTIWLPAGQRQHLDRMLLGKETDKMPQAADSLQQQLLEGKNKVESTSQNATIAKPSVFPQFSLDKALLGKKIVLKSLKISRITQVNDSAYLLLPAAVLSEKLPVTLKLRVISVWPVSNTFQDYQLVYDTIEKASVVPRHSRQAGTQVSASLGRENEAVVINFQPAASPLPRRVADSLSGEFSSQSPAQDKTTATSAIFRYILFLGLPLSGLFLIVWAARRYFVFYVALKPPKEKEMLTEKDDFYKPLKTTVSYDELPGNINGFTPPENPPPIPVTEGMLAPNHLVDPMPLPVDPGPVRENSAERYFFSEVMLTAGPRKKFMSEPDADKDLGEDVCGFLSDGRQLILWLLDGTSDQYCLKNPENNREYFSSRLLAQSLAYQMRSAFNQVPDKNLYERINQAVDQVKTDWLRVMAELPIAEINVLKTNIAGKNIPECATTLLFGHLSIAGELSAYRSGDSKMVFYTRQPNGNIQYTETELARKNAASNDRLFFRLVINEAGELDILYNQPKFELVRQDQVAALIAFSDGIGPETESLLQQSPHKQMNEIRNLIIYQAQGTADDKSLCLVEIKEVYPDVESKVI